MLDRRKFSLALAAAAIASRTQIAYPAGAAGDAVRELLRQRIDVEKRSLGMVVALVTPNDSTVITWGRQRRDGPAIKANTIFEIGSITKVFTALLLADMVRLGEMSFDDPAARHLPSDFQLPSKDGRQITLADLATHTSGLPRFPTFPGTRGSAEWIEAQNRYTIEDLKTWLATFQLQTVPGSTWSYSNLGYNLLAWALAHRGGRPYEDLLAERVLRPLGLHDTVFRPTLAMKPRLAQGHDAKLNPLPLQQFGIFTGAGNLLSTARDMGRFAEAILSPKNTRFAQDNRLLLTVQRSSTGIGGVPALWFDGKQAMGWEVLDAPGGPFVSKDGVTFDQAASMVFDPSARQAVIALSNTFPDLSVSTLSGGGIGTADLARHILRPQVPLNGTDGARY